MKVLSEFAINSGSAHQKQVDLQRMYDQMCYKDTRIVELNNSIMEKERQIMDLQEMCREHDQVAQAKSMAVQIVNKRLKVSSLLVSIHSQELDSRKFRDMGTGTDGFEQRKERSGRREISPGRAIPQLKMNGKWEWVLHCG